MHNVAEMAFLSEPLWIQYNFPVEGKPVNRLKGGMVGLEGEEITKINTA